MTVLVIALVHAIPVLITGSLTRRIQTIVTVSVVMSLIALASGNPLFLIADLIAIWTSCWLLCLRRNAENKMAGSQITEATVFCVDSDKDDIDSGEVFQRVPQIPITLGEIEKSPLSFIAGVPVDKPWWSSIDSVVFQVGDPTRFARATATYASHLRKMQGDVFEDRYYRDYALKRGETYEHTVNEPPISFPILTQKEYGLGKFEGLEMQELRVKGATDLSDIYRLW